MSVGVKIDQLDAATVEMMDKAGLLEMYNLTEIEIVWSLGQMDDQKTFDDGWIPVWKDFMTVSYRHWHGGQGDGVARSPLPPGFGTHGRALPLTGD